MTGLFGRIQHLVHLGGRHIAGINPADAFAIKMDLDDE
jgi:hypothetical protein